MTPQLPGTGTEPDAGSPNRGRGTAAWAIRQAADDLANRTIGLPADALLPTAEVVRLLRNHGILTTEPAPPAAAPPLAPWVCIWADGQRLTAIPAATTEDAEMISLGIQKTGGEARVAQLMSPADAAEIAASTRVAVEAAFTAARRLYETGLVLDRLTPPATPTENAHEQVATTNLAWPVPDHALTCD